MKWHRIFPILILSILLAALPLTQSIARHGHGGGGHWHGGRAGHWHGGRGGHWHGGGGWRHWRGGWAWGAPFVAKHRLYYRHYYYDNSVSRAYRLIALGKQKIHRGHWYINHGNSARGTALINQGRALIYRGNVILGRY